MDINLTRRQIIIIAAVVLLLIIIVIALLVFNKSDESADEFVPAVYDTENINAKANTKQVEVADEEAVSAIAIARNFTARYLSYSNENWGDNINVLYDQMTEGMQQRAQYNLIALQEDYPDDEFYGVSAKVLSQDIISENGDDYTLSQSVQLKKTIGTKESVDYVSYEIDLIESGDGWLVDNLSMSE